MFQPLPTAYSPFTSYGVGSPVVDFPGYQSGSGAAGRVPVPIPVPAPASGVGVGIEEVGGRATAAASAGTGGSRASFRGPVFSPVVNVNANANNGNAISSGRTLNFNQQQPAVRLFKMEGHINDMEEQQRLAAEYEAQLEVRLCYSKMRAFC